VSESLFIQIPGDIDVFDRSDLYEKPLNKALREAGRLGKTVGGGSGMSLDLRGLSVNCCYLDVDVKDLPRAVPVVRGALVRAKVPAGTLVGHPDSDSVLLHFRDSGPEVVTPVNGPLPTPTPRVPWAAGEVIGYRLTPDRWVLLHVVGVTPWVVVVRVPEWCEAELPTADEIPGLLRRRPTKYPLVGTFLFRTGHHGAFWVQLNRPRMLNVRRTLRTGVTAKPRRASAFEGQSVTDPAHFDETLAEVFGLVSVDGATRLYIDLGIGPMHQHLAAWDAGRSAVTAAGARDLFYAYVRSNPVKDQPLRGTVRTTAKTRRFVEELKVHFKETGVWGWGSFRAAEGFVIIPVDGERLAEVWPVAVRLGKAHGITVYDPQENRVIRPQRGRRAARMLR
jgi:hypothetical protein